MYNLFLSRLGDGHHKPSYSTYARIFKTKNFAFHHPKKEKCSLCLSYRELNDEIKTKLQEKYDKHIFQKNKRLG